MLLLNYSHPLTDKDLAEVQRLLGERPEVRQIECNLDTEAPFAPQIIALADAAGLNAQEWQSRPIIFVLPALSQAAGVLLAELHGRMGYFPTIVRVKQLKNVPTPQYVVAEIVELQTIRDAARARR